MTGIIILNYETWDATLECMKSIEQAEPELDYQIYLVDNASQTPMPSELHAYIEQNKTRVTFLKSEKNKGYSAGNNIGIKAALEDQCEEILITNNDILFQECSITGLKNFVQKDRMNSGIHAGKSQVKQGQTGRKIGIAAPRVIGMDGNTQPSTISRKTGMKEIFQIYTIAKLFCRKAAASYFCQNRDMNQSQQVYHVSGCCFLMTREAALAMYPLDENTFLYDEELILGIRMEQQGFETWYVSDSEVIHHHGHTTDRVKPFMYQCISESELYYCSQYLHAKKWQLWLLKEYRWILYVIRSWRDGELRAYKKKYQEAVERRYEEMVKGESEGANECYMKK